MKLATLIPLTLAVTVAAQAPKAPTKAPAPAKADPAAKDPKKEAQEAAAAKEAQEARQQFIALLDAVDASWFGPAYKDIKAVDIEGSLNLTLSASALNKKIGEASQGAVQGNLTKSGSASLRMKSTYFARGDFRTEFTGDFGNVLWTRVGNKGFIYSKEQGAYTTAVDLGAPDAPITWMAWFRESILDIRKAYVDAPTFRASLGKQESAGGKTLQTLIFQAPTAAYDPKKREQPVSETLVFWKRGHMQLTYDKATRLPVTMIYTNEGQGIRTRMDFTYTAQNRLQRVAVNNQSRGFEGPGGLQVTYGEDGRMSRIAGELTGKERKIAFDLGLSWAKEKSEAAIRSVPPPTAKKMGRDEFETMLLVASAGQFMELQRAGWNIMAPKVAVAVSK